ncbi:coiled-coil domain-containing protein 124-B-like [Tubulanus polymorphus]|uniref:coiled-coil domain-containing protein 124-B-like n=1 Tax=Tubulanus polymorphus TaxID=672921 RepID=UPI003DA3A38E
MPKKFPTENSKAAAARERKQAKKSEEADRQKKAEDDAYWADNDKHVTRKQNRKDEKDKKKQEQLQKKQELKKLHDEEMESVKGKSAPAATTKVTRAQVEEFRRKEAEAAMKKKQQAERIVSVDDMPLEENVNRLTIDGSEARNVDEAITVLGDKDQSGIDRHPEKRMKAAYTAFEEENLPILKQQNPNMRLSQLKQMLKKDWMKSPQNPMNQRLQAQH